MKTPAQENYLKSLFSANENIYKFSFRDADSAIQKLKLQHAADYLPQILSANYCWWQIISGNDSPEMRKKYYQLLDEALGKLYHKNKKDYSHDSLYALITAYGYKARIHSMNYEYFPALKQLDNCIDHLATSFGREQEYEWFLLSSGMYNYYVEAVKKNYPFLIPYLLFLPSGNAGDGIKFLEKAASSENTLLKTEANYFLMKIYLEEEKNFPKALVNADYLVKAYPANLLYRYYRFKTLLNAKNIDQAVVELAMIKHHAEKNSSLSEDQKNHFIKITRQDLEHYYKK